MEATAVWYLEGINLFGKLCPIKAKESPVKPEMTEYMAGDNIYIPGDNARYLHIIEQGRVRIGAHNSDGTDYTKALLREGEVFGEMILAGEEVRTEFVECMEDDTRICSIDKEALKGLISEDADMSLRIVKWMGLRMQRLERKIESLTFKDARTRITDFLKDAAAFKGTRVGHEWMIKTKLTHRDIATLTATSRQTVSEILNDLRREDRIFFERGKILIRDLDNLS